MESASEILFCAVIYILRTGVVVSSSTIHRLLVTAIVVAMKYLEDVTYLNKYMACVGGLPLAALNRLEIEFLNMLNFNLHIDADEYQRFCRGLNDLVEDIVFMERPTRAVFGGRCDWDSCTAAFFFANKFMKLCYSEKET